MQGSGALTVKTVHDIDRCKKFQTHLHVHSLEVGDADPGVYESFLK